MHTPQPRLLSTAELVDRRVDYLEEFARPTEPIPLFPSLLFESSVIFTCPISRRQTDYVDAVLGT